MPDFAITGKKGGGKSLIAVAKMRDYLNKGLPVATNLDLDLRHLVGKDNKTARVVRLPDKPSGADLEMLGMANKTPNEELNGILVLDELATWLNSRDFKDKDRAALISWLVQARKDGWDCYYLVQDISMVDKQIREGLFEHVAVCRRSDRLTVPVLNGLSKFFLNRPFHLPRVHFAHVKYGDSPSAALIVDRWVYRGTDLFNAYDTKQKFRSDYKHGPYSYLTPHHLYGRSKIMMTWGNVMRITKIYFRKYSKVGLFFSALFLSLLLAGGFIAYSIELPAAPEVADVSLIDALVEGKIVAYTRMPNRPPSLVLSYGKDQKITSEELAAIGYQVKFHSSKLVTISKGGRNVQVSG